ncbi:phosphatidylglycerophosphatase A [Acetobacter lambici]|uniref:Phosphatidylglycerophosphatase A n=1 Tax=Acetobacter lambici TaxID=1332824 RepID=A0ABT1EVP0_9PROT|nr:phosphatidylglycerophosphatase A [Acetobacter lambici]MCP1241314.1 phosphatidylglycerophosphatase A [Acetobacter lambici]MCP1257016.1 phosphatidylglycerophosphatase A [Acetobacter lambici]NHO55509.1 phosphatidylglycerophosphatase A [Acetobacter lambici]
MTPARLIATFGGCGLAPRAPGTVGSAAALLVGLPLLRRPRALVCAAVAATLVGWWATARAGEGEDHSWIVIDEVAGMWIALLACLPDSNTNETAARTTHRLLWPIVAFGLFRAFDITKPGPIGTLDKRHDALGVMGDDVLAGAASAGCVLALRKIWALRS